jgi:hypothetical protein
MAPIATASVTSPTAIEIAVAAARSATSGSSTCRRAMRA